MKRSTVHFLFALVVLCLASLAVTSGWKLHQHKKLLKALAAEPASITLDSVSSHSDNNNIKSGHPALKLARASALSNGGQFDAAESLLVELIDSQSNQSLAQAAQFNLANHYLRQGSRVDLPGAQTRPLLEMAKQRYRDLLRTKPMDWDARYNLERALALAPERVDVDPEHGPPPKSVRVIVPDFEADHLP